jgi:uncharacterized protein YidB (DUF937 family)
VSDILGSILGSALKGLAGQAGQQERAPAGLPDILAQVLGKTDLGSLGGLLQQLEQSGLGAQVASWLGNGQNLPVTIEELRNALGEQPLRQLASQFDLPVDELLRHLAQHLPNAVDGLSRNGSLARDLGPE